MKHKEAVISLTPGVFQTEREKEAFVLGLMMLGLNVLSHDRAWGAVTSELSRSLVNNHLGWDFGDLVFRAKGWMVEGFECLDEETPTC